MARIKTSELTGRVTEDELWQAQLKHYPRSVRLSVKDMLEWAGAPLSHDEQLARYRRLALCLQYEPKVFYRTEPGGKGYMGCRYGVEGNEYVSNFED